MATSVEWVEPGENDEPVIQIISIEEAVKIAKAVAATKGYTYSSDQDALEDFVTVHWAIVK